MYSLKSQPRHPVGILMVHLSLLRLCFIRHSKCIVGTMKGCTTAALYFKRIKKNIYTKAFSRSKSSTFALNFILDPKLVLLDFEKAAISAIKEVFPSCKVLGCYFHFIQAFWKNIQSKGLTDEYRNEPFLKIGYFILINNKI